MKKKEGDDKKKEKKQVDRGAVDDWEALKMVLEDSPALKQRVLHKMREMKNKSPGDIKVDAKDAKNYQREQKAKGKGG